jgi:hypothetical protein
MGKKLDELAREGTEYRSIDLYEALAEVAR